jgi:hypothetical protein
MGIVEALLCVFTFTVLLRAEEKNLETVTNLNASGERMFQFYCASEKGDDDDHSGFFLLLFSDLVRVACE